MGRSKKLKKLGTKIWAKRKQARRRKQELPDPDDSDAVKAASANNEGPFEATKHSSSDNLAKLPTLTMTEYKFFKLVKDGELVALQDFMETPEFSQIHINKTDKLGFSALHYAVRRQDEEMVKLLLSQKEVLLFDTLFHAIQEQNEGITRTLLQHQDRVRPPDPGIQVMGKTSNNTALVGLPSVLSPTQITSRRSFQDLEEFDSEFPTYFTPLLVSAKLGNPALMELFYSRGERLESSEEHHNCGCKCRICLRTDKGLASASERVDLFEALSQPKYVCFLAEKSGKGMDPVSYALDKIKKCKELEEKEGMFSDKYKEMIKRLEEFVKDLVDLCRTNEETQTFFSAPDKETQGRLKGKYPRLWNLVGLDMVNVVAHPHAQYIVNRQWVTAYWPEWTTYGFPRKCAELVFRTVLLPFIVLFLWLGTSSKLGKKLACPCSRFLNWLAAYFIFLCVLAVQVIFPQRCNSGEEIREDGEKRTRIPYRTADKDCGQRGNPNVGTEWVLVLYVFGFVVSMMKRHSIPWFWHSHWAKYEIVTQLLFKITFTFWFSAWFYKDLDVQPRKEWAQDYPEVLGDVFLSLACILAFGRILMILQLDRKVGPLQVGLGRMFLNFLSTFIVLVIVIFSFSLGLYAIYIPFNELSGYAPKSGDQQNQTSPFGNAILAPIELFWSLYGMSGSDKHKIIEFAVPVNATHTTRSHPLWTERAGRLLFQFYHILGVLMMFNMLVAYFSAGAEEVSENADAEWKFARTRVYMMFMKDTRLPPPFNLIPTLRGIVRFFHYIGLLCFGESIGEKAACSFTQCCYIKEPIDRKDEKEHRKAYRRLVLELLHRYKAMAAGKDNEKAATSDDVKEIGEELAELKSELQTRIREWQQKIRAQAGGRRSGGSGGGGGEEVRQVHPSGQPHLTEQESRHPSFSFPGSSKSSVFASAVLSSRHSQEASQGQSLQLEQGQRPPTPIPSASEVSHHQILPVEVEIHMHQHQDSHAPSQTTRTSVPGSPRSSHHQQQEHERKSSSAIPTPNLLQSKPPSPRTSHPHQGRKSSMEHASIPTPPPMPLPMQPNASHSHSHSHQGRKSSTERSIPPPPPFPGSSASARSSKRESRDEVPTPHIHTSPLHQPKKSSSTPPVRASLQQLSELQAELFTSSSHQQTAKTSAEMAFKDMAFVAADETTSLRHHAAFLEAEDQTPTHARPSQEIPQSQRTSSSARRLSQEISHSPLRHSRRESGESALIPPNLQLQHSPSTGNVSSVPSAPPPIPRSSGTMKRRSSQDTKKD